MNPRIAVLSAAGGAVLWGTIGPVAALFSPQERLASGAVRLAIGASTLLLLGGRTRLRRNDVLPLALGAVGVAGFQLTYFAAVGASGVAVSTAVGIGLAPILTGLWTSIGTRRAPSTWWVVGTVFAVGGLCLLAFAGGGPVTVSPLGLLLSAAAAAFFSVQVVAMQTLVTRHAGTTVLSAMFALAALLLMPVTIATATPSMLSPTVISGVVYLGVVTAGVAYWLYARGASLLDAPAAATISLLEPAGAAVLAAVLLHEHVSHAQWLGIVCICGAIALTALPTRLTEAV
jgi:DME family drug/metabolite transporter